jgi:2-dehydro-3-deoxy-D-arabinonate dehydratase
VAYDGGRAGRQLAVLRDATDAAAVVVFGEPGEGSAGSLSALISSARRQRREIYGLLDELAERSRASVDVDFDANVVRDGDSEFPLAVPVDAPEVWAAGVSYLRSRRARERESAKQPGDFYGRVYEAERPELFLKDAECRRTVAPGGSVAVRGDSSWTVPEPEVALVLDADGRIVAYTIGNDVSARDIEGENPLYLAQSKTYARSCSLGPAICFPGPDVRDHTFNVVLRVYDAGGLYYEGEASTTTMRRSFDELATYLLRYNVIADGTVLLTGTGIVPPDEFALRSGHVVEIEVPGIGVLRNPVIQLAADQTAGAGPDRATVSERDGD